MNAQQISPLNGIVEQVFGVLKAVVVELAGPSSYAAGGQTITAASLGWGGIVGVVSLGRSYSGTYETRGAQYLAVDATPSAQKPPSASVKVPWYNISDALEVTATTDLDSEIVRLLILGI